MAERVIDRLDPDGYCETSGVAPVTGRAGVRISLAADRGYYSMEANAVTAACALFLEQTRKTAKTEVDSREIIKAIRRRSGSLAKRP